ncbi:MAG: acyl--CoA ligase [Deltaproteobacteria bacterium]|nr:acyl--CoA ligase [Deltaproteobacteria bacterium]
MTAASSHARFASLVRYLEHTAERLPRREAVIFKQRRVSYEELWSWACSIAAYLRRQGIEPGDRVAILMENSPEYIAAYYGALMASAVAVGLNTATKSRDIVNWLNHSQARWLFADGRHAELPLIAEKIGRGLRLVTHAEPGKPLEEMERTDWAEVLQESGEKIDLSTLDDPERLASIIYTSGTTGEPKGVVLSHGNLVANIESILEYLRLKESDSIVNVLPFYYSYGNSVLHTHIAAGGCLILENSLVYPHKVMQKIVEEKATGFSGVPSTFALLMSRTKLTDYNLSAMRYMTQAGGPMPPANVQRLTEELPHIQFFVMYGQTEACARLTYLPPERLKEKLGSAGTAIPGVEIEIRDEAGNPVPVGTKGEIWARGENIMKGYWRNPEMTQEVLRDGWLKTGDLARIDEERYIYIIGRNSDMIKVGAHRISPKEVEEVIAELEAVEEVAAVGVADEMLGQVVKAVVIRKKGAQLESKAIQRHCLNNLAQYKIPKYIEFAESLPKTASGKVKRHLL